MSDTSVTTETPTTPSPPPALPNDPAARSTTGEILEPSQQTTQTPPPSTTTSTEPKPPGSETKTTTPPETYSAFTAPEGYTLDSKAIEAATSIFKELGLSQEAAQKLVDFHTAQMIDAAKAPATEYEATRSEWQAKAKADPELTKAVSGNATGLDAVKIDISRALSAIGDAALASEFKDAMNITGVGDHPAFIKTFWKLSQFVTEGKHVAGTNPSPHGQRAPGESDRPSGAKAMYPNLP